MMVGTYPSPTVTFDVVWRAALKSEPLRSRDQEARLTDEFSTTASAESAQKIWEGLAGNG
jgi:hypothetical protein